ncbi:MAG: DUF4837 family protein [Saprospiraceae bacterium]|nr:DUF4837 family protein [Saprospiraceae bacterium]
MKYLKIFFAFSILLLAACSSDTSGSGQVATTSKGKVQSHGRVNQVLVIADSSLWKGAVGDTFFYYFSAPYILLPQPEPIFDLVHMTPEQLAKQPLKKEFRTIVLLADLNDENSTTARLLRADLGPEKLVEIQNGKGYNVTIGQDKWAVKQQLFYVNGFGEDKLTECIAVNFPAIGRKINERDQETVKATAYQGGEDTKLEGDIFTKYNLKMQIPKGFKQAKYDGTTNTLWLRSDEREIIANIIVHKLPYKDKSQLTKAGIKKIRDGVTGIVTTQQPNTYMRINDVDLPLFVENITLNNAYTVQAKGVWDIVNDFKGGPFVSNLMLNPKTNELVLVDGFVFAPGKDKRNYMQELELVLSTASF